MHGQPFFSYHKKYSGQRWFLKHGNRNCGQNLGSKKIRSGADVLQTDGKRTMSVFSVAGLYAALGKTCPYGMFCLHGQRAFGCSFWICYDVIHKYRGKIAKLTISVSDSNGDWWLRIRAWGKGKEKLPKLPLCTLDCPTRYLLLPTHTLSYQTPYWERNKSSKFVDLELSFKTFNSDWNLTWHYYVMYHNNKLLGFCFIFFFINQGIKII